MYFNSQKEHLLNGKQRRLSPLMDPQSRIGTWLVQLGTSQTEAQIQVCVLLFWFFMVTTNFVILYLQKQPQKIKAYNLVFYNSKL